MGRATEIAYGHGQRLFVGEFSKIVIGLSTPACDGDFSGKGWRRANLRSVFPGDCATLALLDRVELFSGTV